MNLMLQVYNNPKTIRGPYTTKLVQVCLNKMSKQTQDDLEKEINDWLNGVVYQYGADPFVPLENEKPKDIKKKCDCPINIIMSVGCKNPNHI